MKNILTAVVALSGFTFAAVPHVSLKAVQPFFENLYGVSPRLGVGIGFPQSSNFAFRTELAGSYGTGRPGLSSYRTWSLSVRAAEQANIRPLVDAYFGVGVMYVYARERWPYADTNGVITDRWGSGSAMGVFTEAGVILARGHRFRLDFEVGLDIGAVQTDLPVHGQYQLIRYSTISLTGLGAGFVFSLGEL